MWLTKDKPTIGFPNGRIKLHINEPYKIGGIWICDDNSITSDPYMYLPIEFDKNDLTFDKALEVELIPVLRTVKPSFIK